MWIDLFCLMCIIVVEFELLRYEEVGYISKYIVFILGIKVKIVDFWF